MEGCYFCHYCIGIGVFICRKILYILHKQLSFPWSVWGSRAEEMFAVIIVHLFHFSPPTGFEVTSPCGFSVPATIPTYGARFALESVSELETLRHGHEVLKVRDSAGRDFIALNLFPCLWSENSKNTFLIALLRGLNEHHVVSLQQRQGMNMRMMH